MIIVGDAAMAPEELYSDTGNYRGPNGGLSGYEWLQLLKKKYKKVVWLNPKMAPGRAPGVRERRLGGHGVDVPERGQRLQSHNRRGRGHGAAR